MLKVVRLERVHMSDVISVNDVMLNESFTRLGGKFFMDPLT